MPIQHSVAEPIKSEVYSEGAVSPGGPIRHTIVTEDGQRLSVDINLKVLSPRSDSVQQQPIGGHPMYGAETKSQVPPASYQQNPTAFRPHMSLANHQQVHVAPDYPLSPQHQMAPAGHYGSGGITQGYVIHQQVSRIIVFCVCN